METAERIDYPALLPEGPPDALLMEMLVPAPYKVQERKTDKKAPGTRKGLRRKVMPEASSEDDEAHSSHEGEERKKKTASTEGGEGSKKGRTLLPDYSTTTAYRDKEWLPRDKPLAKS